MNILISGGAGFIGSHLTRALHSLGHSVTIIDNLSTASPALHQARLASLPADIPFFNIDCSDAEKINNLFSEHTFDAVYHLAAHAGVRRSIEEPLMYAHANITGTVAILEAAKKYGVTQIILASSSSVYGSNTKTPFSEDDSVCMPQSPYAVTKRSIELFAYTYATLHTLNINCMRFFTVYGPYGRPDMAPWIFTERIMRGEEIYVFNHGKQKRDFTYIEDIIAGLVAVLNYKNGFEIFNLGAGKQIPLMDFIALIERELGVSAHKHFTEAAQGDVVQTYADVSKAQKLLGYAPTVSIEEGMKKFIDWYKGYTSIV